MISMKFGLSILIASVVFSVTLMHSRVAANEEIPAPVQTQAVVLKGAVIHPVSGPDIADGEIVFEDGKITALGRGLTLPEGAKVIDATGKHIYPGLISAHTVLGLTEIQSVRGTADIAEPGTINPNARAQVAINPDSELLPVARANGVLTALAVPKTQDGLISGLSTLVHLDGWTWEQMTVKPTVGLHVFWPELRIEKDPRYPQTPEEQQKDIDRRLRELRDTFDAARAYARASEARTERRTDVRFAAMLPVLRGEIPVFVHANDIRQIESAVQWTAAEHLKLVIVGGQDAWRVTDLLKEHDVPVIVSPVNALPLRRWEGYDAAYANAGKLQAAGVRFCIANDGSDFEAAHERNLPYQAAQAAAHGLPREEALRAVTLYPAQILGVADRTGSLDVGKEATLIVTTGDPLEIFAVEGSHVERGDRPLASEKYSSRISGGRTCSVARELANKYEQFSLRHHLDPEQTDRNLQGRAGGVPLGGGSHHR